MKKMLLFKVLALVAFLACALGASSETIDFSAYNLALQLTVYSDGSGVVTVQKRSGNNYYSGVVNIPDSVYYSGKMYPVTGIGYQAFKNCTGLTSVTIPEGVTMLLNESFAGCTSLTSIVLPSTMTTIYNNAFVGCTNLTSITCMRETPRSFDANNFDASTFANATLYVPQGSKSSYQSTAAWMRFANIQEINKFVVDGIYYTVTSGNNVSVTYRDTNYRTYFGYVNIPATVTYHGVTYNVTAIGASAFRDSSTYGRDLHVIIPNSVTTIGNYAFYSSRIYFIEMGSRVSSIGEYAFAGTEDNLTIIICHAMMPPTIASNTFAQGSYDRADLWIPRMAFGRYTSARYWSEFDESRLYYCYDFFQDGVYYGINSYSNTVEVVAYGIAVDGSSLHPIKSKQESITVPPTVTYDGVQYTVNRVGSYVHYGWAVKDITLPNTIVTIDDYAYYGCDSLENISMSEGVTRIGMMAFYYNTHLKSVLIPNSVKVIDYGAFYGCTGLETLFIGAGVEEIGYCAFKSSENLSRIVSYALIPPVSSSGEDPYFFSDKTYDEAVLQVALSSIPAYQNSTEWGRFYNVWSMHTLDEALNAPGGNIHFEESDYPWSVWDDGERLFAMSGNAGVHNSSSTLSTTVKVSEPSILSFDFKAWGESDPDNPNTDYDECVFMSNGTSVFRYGARDNDWETFYYELQPNVTYQLRWYYHKDVSINGSGDYFALDNVKIEPKVARGDVTGDGSVNISDVTVLINYLMSQDTSGVNMSGADCTQDGNVNISDVTALINYLLNEAW